MSLRPCPPRRVIRRSTAQRSDLDTAIRIATPCDYRVVLDLVLGGKMVYFLYERGTEKKLGRLTDPVYAMSVGENFKFARKDWVVVSVQPNVGLPDQSTVMVSEI